MSLYKIRVARYISMISQKSYLIGSLANINEESVFIKMEEGKYPRSFCSLRASVKQIFHRVEYRPESLDIYLNGTLEGIRISLLSQRSRGLALYDTGIMELGSRSKRFQAPYRVCNLSRRESGFIKNRFVKQFSTLSRNSTLLWDAII